MLLLHYSSCCYNCNINHCYFYNHFSSFDQYYQHTLAQARIRVLTEDLRALASKVELLQQENSELQDRLRQKVGDVWCGMLACAKTACIVATCSSFAHSVFTDVCMYRIQVSYMRISLRVLNCRYVCVCMYVCMYVCMQSAESAVVVKQVQDNAQAEVFIYQLI